MMAERVLVLYFFILEGIQAGCSNEDRRLKRVYGNSVLVEQCNKMCKRQKLPLCAATRVRAGVCELLAPEPSEIIPAPRDRLLQCPEFTCPWGFAHMDPVGMCHVTPSCYLFVRTRLSWYSARKTCREKGADLGSIETKAENKHLYNILINNTEVQKPVSVPELFGLQYWGYWIGGSDLRVEADWRWVATGVKLSFYNWKPGQPNNQYGLEDCLHMVREYDWQWNDSACVFAGWGALCEAPAVPVD